VPLLQTKPIGEIYDELKLISAEIRFRLQPTGDLLIYPTLPLWI